MERVHRFRRTNQLAYYFDWQTHIDWRLQEPFEPSHDNMARLNLHPEQPTEQLAAELRRAFSGIVAGNVKAYGIEQIERHGPYRLNGDPAIMAEMERLLRQFARQKRMKLSGKYQPCYESSVLPATDNSKNFAENHHPALAHWQNRSPLVLTLSGDVT